MLSVVVTRVVPVSEFVSVTVAPGTTALAGSMTVPCNPLETVCPNRQAAKSVKAQRICASFLIIINTP